jgi:polysaccharide biosynthesis/export protein
MSGRSRQSSRAIIILFAATCASCMGCVADSPISGGALPELPTYVNKPGFPTDGAPPPNNYAPPPNTCAPRELDMTALPPYVLEPPDILLINTLRVIPKPPYKIEPLDTLLIQVTNTLPGEPIAGLAPVDPDGTVNLGASYGLFRVAGMTLQEAQDKIQTELGERVLKNPRVNVSLSTAHGMQQIQGEHLVRPDGTVGLGTYGSAYVVGLTLEQARKVIEAHLGRSLLQPEISIDVYAYNSKYCYVIADGAGYGQQIIRLPITGRETVLDAVSQIYGLPQVSSAHHIWVARPHGECPDQLQMLPVDWAGLTMGGNPKTNYQLFPGDRVYIQANCFITLNNRIAQFLAPIERVMGVTLLGAATVNGITNATTRNTGNNSGTGF